MGGSCFIFGMTGFLTYIKDSEKPLGDHVRFILEFSNRSRLGFDCRRVFGRLTWIRDLNKYLQDHKLGADALVISESDFVQRVEGSRSSIKMALMDQSIPAGIGNVYSDEILYKARIHPTIPVKSLNEASLHRVYRSIQTV